MIGNWHLGFGKLGATKGHWVNKDSECKIWRGNLGGEKKKMGFGKLG